MVQKKYDILEVIRDSMGFVDLELNFEKAKQIKDIDYRDSCLFQLEVIEQLITDKKAHSKLFYKIMSKDTPN